MLSCNMPNAKNLCLRRISDSTSKFLRPLRVGPSGGLCVMLLWVLLSLSTSMSVKLCSTALLALCFKATVRERGAVNVVVAAATWSWVHTQCCAHCAPSLLPASSTDSGQQEEMWRHQPSFPDCDSCELSLSPCFLSGTSQLLLECALTAALAFPPGRAAGAPVGALLGQGQGCLLQVRWCACAWCTKC